MLGWGVCVCARALGMFIASFVHGRVDAPAPGLAMGGQALLSVQSWPGLMSFSSSSTRHALIPAKSAQQNKLEMWSGRLPVARLWRGCCHFARILFIPFNKAAAEVGSRCHESSVDGAINTSVWHLDATRHLSCVSNVFN